MIVLAVPAVQNPEILETQQGVTKAAEVANSELVRARKYLERSIDSIVRNLKILREHRICGNKPEILREHEVLITAVLSRAYLALVRSIGSNFERLRYECTRHVSASELRGLA